MNQKKDEAGPQRELPANVFATNLADIDKGRALSDASEKLTQIVRACRQTGKKGKLTLKIVVKPVPKTEGTRVLVDYDVKPEIPEADKGTTLFFTTDEGALTRRDPDQMDWIDQAKEGGGKAVTVAGGAVVTREDLKAAAR